MGTTSRVAGARSPLGNMRVASIVVVLVLITIQINVLIFPATANQIPQCPPFDCSKGTWVSGFFTGQSSDGQISQEMGSPLLTQGTTDPDMQKLMASGAGRSNMIADGRQVLSALSTTTLTECTDFCISYNRQAASAGGVLAGFWTMTLSIIMDSVGGSKFTGKCYCYSPDVCKGDGQKPVFDDRCNALARSTSVWTLSATGSLCITEGKGDPHFTGADDSHFDFTGIPNKSFALLSDHDLQVNAFFGGRYEAQEEDGSEKAMTWMRKVGILWRSHSIILEAREGPVWQYGEGYMQRMAVDGHSVFLSEAGAVAKHSFNDGFVQITWMLAGEPDGDDFIDKYEVKLGDELTLMLTLRPEVAGLRTEEDGVVHFTVEVISAKLSEDVHGIVGQTYRPDFAGRLKGQNLVWNEVLQQEIVPTENGKGFLDGDVEDYLVSNILATDCKVSKFNPIARMRQSNRRMKLN